MNPLQQIANAPAAEGDDFPLPRWLRRLLGMDTGPRVIIGEPQEVSPRNMRDGAALQKLVSDPLLTDTLQSLVGGDVPLGYFATNPGENAAGIYSPPENLLRSMLFGRGEDITFHASALRAPTKVASHEFGHAFDFRGISPGLTETVASRFDETDPNTYEGSSPREHFASIFARAIELLRHPAAFSAEDDLLKSSLELEDQEHPGVVSVLRYLVTHSPYSSHPIASVLLAPLPAQQAQPPR